LEAQKVKYTELEREDSRNMNFEIIGKVGKNNIIYKGIRSDHSFSLYDAEMKLVERVSLANMPQKIIAVDFVNMNTHYYMIYQYEKKNIVYCEAIKFNADGKKLEEAIELDTTRISIADNPAKIYNILVSDNKQKISIAKANKKNDRNHVLGIVMLDGNMKKVYKKFYTIATEGRNNFLDDFCVDNDGDVYMTKCYSTSGYEYVSKYKMLHIPYMNPELTEFNMPSRGLLIDDVVLKIDNSNKKVISQGFYLSKKRGNIDGIYVSIFDRVKPTDTASAITKFEDSLRVEAKGVNNTKMAFNDFFIVKVIPKKDGSYITLAECTYQTNRNNTMPLTRWDYYNSTNYLTSFDYYNMGGRAMYFNSTDRFSNNYLYYAENVAVLNFTKNGKLEWANVVHKNQKSEFTEDYISFETALLNGEIFFLFNENERNFNLLNVNSVAMNGNLTRHPTFKNLNREYELMPRHGKQISSKEFLMPCLYKNFICFAKVEF
jgi:hypothetical protein